MTKQTQIVGHPSIGELLVGLLKSGDRESIDVAAALYRLIQQLNVDPSGKNIPWINVCPFREFIGKAFILHTIFRARIVPFQWREKGTHYRALFVCDQDLGCNIYLFLGLKNYDGNLATYDKNWKTRLNQRYWEFAHKLKKQYLSGITPRWRTS